MAQGKDNQQIDSQEINSRDVDRQTTDDRAKKDSDSGSAESPPRDAARVESLYFFPEDEVTETRARAILASDSVEERAWVISNLMRYAQWDDIWTYVDRDTVRAMFEHLDLPENLRTAWARMLKIEAPVA